MTRSPGLARALAPALLLAGTLALFAAPLLGRASGLSFDNRLFAPLRFHARGDEAARPMNLVGVDLNAFHAPESIVAAERLRRGELPLWSERALLGAPLLASMGAQVLYPTAALLLVLDPLRALSASRAAHVLLLALGVYAYLRRRGHAPPAGLLGAAAVGWSSFASLYSTRPGFLAAFAWLPWIALAAERCLARATPGRAAWLASTVGLCALAGAPQLAACAVYAGLALGALAARAELSAQAAASTVGATLLGALLAAVLLLPAAELYRASARAAGAPGTEPADLAAPALAALLLPHAFGHPVQRVSPVAGGGFAVEAFPTRARFLTPAHDDNLVENALHFGAVPAVLACLALARRRWTVDDRAHIVLGGAALLAALGVPFLAPLVRALPGVGVGSPKRLLALFVFAGGALAASGATRVARGRIHPAVLGVAGALLLLLSAVALAPFERLVPADPEHRAWLRATLLPDLVQLAVGGAALVAAGVLAAGSRHAWAAWLLALASAGTLFASFRGEHPPQTPGHPYGPTPAVEWLRGRGRVVSFGPGDPLPGPLALASGLRSVHGFHPLVGRELHELCARLDRSMLRAGGRSVRALESHEALASPLLDLFGARFVAAEPRDAAALEAAVGAPAYRDAREGLVLFERPAALPPAFLARSVEVVPDRGARLARMAAPDFRPADVAFVERPTELARTATLGAGPVRVARPRPEVIEAEVECDGPALLVVVESAAPGWRASVDGEPAELHRADHAFLGVELEAGAHRVELRYSPAGFATGRWISLGAVAGVLGLSLAGWRRRAA
ncbi:MAG: YfhO family protein [Planctomycetota bacterium]